jgi:hypothetical protein
MRQSPSSCAANMADAAKAVNLVLESPATSAPVQIGRFLCECGRMGPIWRSVCSHDVLILIAVAHGGRPSC